MIELFFIVKTLHILSASILFGTGIGIAFFLFASHVKGASQEKFFNAKITVLADFVFTLPAVLLQPLTGLWLIYEGGYNYTELWLLITYGLYFLMVISWIPVVFIQIKLKNILQEAQANNSTPHPSYDRLIKIWFFLGWPAFVSIFVIFYLMIARPV
ncbi:DUF2269 family protein [Sneathiella glossodoripedis]|uniref:DUF2269 family protein n=1 Tax=Sneathiella glossodoripedis TaxID=418853 RepID=UPI001900549B